MRGHGKLVAVLMPLSHRGAAILGLCALLAAVSAVRAEVPPLTDLQGIVTENGKPVDRMKRMTFRLTDSGNAIQYWTSGPLDLAIATGAFNEDVDIVYASAPWVTATPYIRVLDEDRPMSLDLGAYPLNSIAGYALHAVESETLAGIAAPFVQIATSVVINPGFLGVGLAVGIAGPLHVRTQAVDALVVSTNGRVGLGTTSPSAQLEIVNGNIKLSQPGSGLVFWDGVLRSAMLDVASGIRNQGDVFIRADSDGNGTGGILMLISGTTSLFVANNGNVGINTSSPSDTLEVGGGAVAKSAVTVQGIGMAGTQTVFQVSRSTFVVRADGRVGIGTSDPQSALQVLGDCLAVPAVANAPGVSPPTQDCDSPSHAGRMIVSMSGEIWVCKGAAGWVSK